MNKRSTNSYGRHGFGRPSVKPWEKSKLDGKLRRELKIKSDYNKLKKKFGFNDEASASAVNSSSKQNDEHQKLNTISHSEKDHDRPRRFEKQRNGETRRKGPNQASRHNSKPTSLKKAKQIYQQKQEERARRKEDVKIRAIEREKAIEKRKKERLEKFKVLNQKTTKGQPVMKGRIQLLLKKIQSQMS